MRRLQNGALRQIGQSLKLYEATPFETLKTLVYYGFCKKFLKIKKLTNSKKYRHQGTACAEVVCVIFLYALFILSVTGIPTVLHPFKQVLTHFGLCGSLALISLPTNAGNGLAWAHGSDLLALGLPALAAGSAWSQADAEGLKQLTYTLGTTVGAAEILKNTVHSTRPDGSDNKSFPSGHTAVAFAAVRFMDKRYGTEMAPYRPWLYAAAGLTGVARVQADKHHWRDVLAGGALGWGAAQFWTDPVKGGQLSVVPTAGGAAVAWYRAW